MENTTIISWNCNGLYSHFEELKLLISYYNPVAICLQETHLQHNQQFKLRSYNIIQSTTEPMEWAHGGVLIAIRSDINYDIINLHCTLEFVAAKIYLDSPIIIGSLYLPPRLNINYHQISQIFGLFPSPFLVMGDFNAHSPHWGSNYYNQKGHVIEELICSLDLTLLNPNDPTHYNFPHRKWSTLDLVVSSPCLSTSFTVFTHKDLSGSDHIPLIVNSTKETSPQSTPINNWNYNKTNWTNFRNNCVDQMNLEQDLDINATVEKFTDSLVNCARSFTTNPSNHRQRRRVPWWSQDCSKAIKNRRKALKTLKRSPNMENHIDFRRLRAKAKWTLKQSRKSSWMDFVSTITPATPSSVVWKKIKSLSSATHFHIPTTIDSNNVMVYGIDNILATFSDFFTSASSDSNLHPEFLRIKNNKNCEILRFDSTNNEPYNKLITIDELKYAITHMRSGATGPDDFHILMAKNAPENILTIMLDIFNKIWISGIFPEVWKTVFIIPLLKPNKNPRILDNYRPISLSSVIGKIFEKILNRRLIWLLESRGLLADNQCGFRPSRSTIDATFCLSGAIHEAISQQQHILAVFFDCSKAFDLTWRRKISEKLHEWGFRGRLPQMIHSFLQNRKFKVKLGGFVSNIGFLDNGVPQGSVLSPTLFNIAIIDVLKVINSPTRSILFADDLTVFIQCKNPTLGKSVLQEAVDNISAWSRDNGFRFSESKTTSIHFCRVRNCDHHLQISLNNTTLTHASNIRYLGLVFDEKLNWKTHINHLKQACFSKINLLKKLSNTHYGANRFSLLNIYKALIRSKCDYGLPVFSSAKNSQLRSLNTIHHTAIRLATGALRTTPINSLLVDANQIPPDLRRHYLILSYLIHLKTVNNLPASAETSITNTASYSNEIFYYKSIEASTSLQLTLPSMQTFSLPTIPPWKSRPFNIDLTLGSVGKSTTHEVIKSAFLEMMSNYPNQVVYYTDGSRSDSAVGCSVVRGNIVSVRFSLPLQFTILSAELYALFLAVQLICSEENNTTHLICTDSMSSILSLNNVHDNKQHPIAKNITKLLFENPQHVITFAWIPGHSGIQGNEIADLAAKEASTFFPIPNVPVPPHDIKRDIQKKMIVKWQQDWEDTSPTTNKLRNIKHCVKPWNTSCKGRRENVVLTRVRLGHTMLTHGHLFKGENTPICTCGVPLTVTHVLSECPNYSAQRLISGLQPSFTKTMEDDKTAVTKLLDFIRTISLYQSI